MIRVKNSAEGAEISISGNIVDDQEGNNIEWWRGEGNTGGYEWPSNIKKQLDAIDDEQPLTIYINSDGGSVAAGVAIANMVARHNDGCGRWLGLLGCNADFLCSRHVLHPVKCIPDDPQAVLRIVRRCV
mgnify:CR=1 FL=1